MGRSCSKQACPVKHLKPILVPAASENPFEIAICRSAPGGEEERGERREENTGGGVRLGLGLGLGLGI